MAEGQQRVAGGGAAGDGVSVQPQSVQRGDVASSDDLSNYCVADSYRAPSFSLHYLVAIQAMK